MRSRSRVRAVAFTGTAWILLLSLMAGCASAPAFAPSDPDEAAAEVSDVAVPTVTGPVTGGTHGMPYNALSQEFLESHGYVEEEYFIEGEATAYAPEGWLGEDGHWTVRETSTAPYKTRILVRRPADPADFDGSVFVEWFNVSAGFDADVDFGFGNAELLRNGSVYVGVSAQQAGVEGGGFALPVPGGAEIGAPKEWDPERYETIEHPGDQYSYDIFSQAAQAIRSPGELDVLGGMTPQQVIAMGQSQSGGRMATYVNAVHPVAHIYDGFLVHGRGSGAASLRWWPVGVARIRDDLDVPVLQFETETEVAGGFHSARQDDTDMIRTWEVAGGAHIDYSQIEFGEALADRDKAESADSLVEACPSINRGPQREVVHAAFAALRSWAAGGEPAASGSPLELEGDAIVRDERGNARGGIRTPAVDAPIAAHTGDGSLGVAEGICGIFGEYQPFEPETLAELYPTHQDYVDAVTESANTAVDAGFLVRTDADALIAEAEAAPIPTE